MENCILLFLHLSSIWKTVFYYVYTYHLYRKLYFIIFTPIIYMENCVLLFLHLSSIWKTVFYYFYTYHLYMGVIHKVLSLSQYETKKLINSKKKKV